MFTGIIEATAKVLEKTEKKLVISRPEIFTELKIGQSIATNGACLSVAEFSEKNIAFDVLSETFRRTNLGEISEVNLERAMPANGRFEGHIVLGHVDTTIPLLKKNPEISGTELVFQMPENSKYLVSKGSISLNGISLTIGNIDTQKGEFSVFLIPLTLQHTNLGSIEISEKVTVEYDYLAKLMMQK